MKKIIFDGKDVLDLVPGSLPMLIHGEEGMGASFYTICLAAKWYSQGYKVLFLCGYPQAEESFSKEIGHDHSTAHFFTKDKVEKFTHTIKSSYDKNTIVIVKNIELFDIKLFNEIVNFDNLIISGDVSRSNFKNELLSKKFTTEVYFSPLLGKDLPPLERYNGYVVTGEFTGVTSIK